MSNLKPSKNALSHGLYSSQIVLPWENQQNFDDLLQALREEYCPDGVSEEAAVFDLATLHWKKRRFEAGLLQALQRQGDPNTVADASSDAWDSVADEARAAGKSQLKAAQLICERIGKHVKRVFESDEAQTDSQAVELETITTLAKELSVISEGLVIPLLDAAEKHDQTERACHLGVMNRDLKFHAEIDRRIEKTLKHLVMIKEFKNFYVPKAIETKSVEIEGLPMKRTGVSESDAED